MTPKQKQTVEMLREQILKHDGCGDAGRGNYEYKRFEITDTDWGGVFVLSVGGVFDDEGTHAELFARRRRHIFIGKRGALKLLNAKKGKPTGLPVLWELTL